MPQTKQKYLIDEKETDETLDYYRYTKISKSKEWIRRSFWKPIWNSRAGNPCKTPYFYNNIFERLTIESFRRRISGAKPTEKVLSKINGKKTVNARDFSDNTFAIILLCWLIFSLVGGPFLSSGNVIYSDKRRDSS